MKLYLDFETASAADLRAVGMKNYMAHPSTRITHTAALVDDAELPEDKLPDLLEHSGSLTIVAHNIAFERAVLERFHPEFAKRVTHWACTASLARQLRGPGDLKKAAKFFGGTAKDSDGSALMKKVCVLQEEEPTRKSGTVLKVPFEWVHEDGYWRRGGEEVDDIMQRYCEQDTLSCRDLYKRLLERTEELGPHDIRTAAIQAEQMTDEANSRGIRIDTVRLKTLVQATEELAALADAYCAEHLGGFKASQVTAIKRYCNEQGLAIDGVGAPDVARIKASGAEHPLIAHLEHRNKLVKSSLRRLPKLKEQLHEGRLHDTLVFSGATATGRWSGRGFQPQNLPRPVEGLDECNNFCTGLQTKRETVSAENADRLTGGIRTLLLPEDGETICSADLSQIELRLSVYHSKHKTYGKLLKEGGDVYLHFAKELYKNPNLTKESEERAICKIAVLSLQYGSGARQFRDYLLTSNGTKITEVEAENIVRKFRELNPGLTERWKKCDTAMIMSSVQGKDHKVKLNSGRVLNYRKVQRRSSRYADGREKMSYAYNNGLYYKNLWGGTIYQNVIQAEARDIFMIKLAGMKKYPEYKLLTTVHDEGVFSIPSGDTQFQRRWEQSGQSTIEKYWPGLHLESDVGKLPCYYK